MTLSIAAEPDAITAGHVLLGDLNGAACHSATNVQAAWLNPEQALLVSLQFQGPVQQREVHYAW